MASVSRKIRYDCHRRGLILVDALRESLLVAAIVAGTVLLLCGSWSKGEPVQTRAASAALPFYAVCPLSSGTQLWAIQIGNGARLLDAASGKQLHGWIFPQGEVSCVSFDTGPDDLAVMVADNANIEFLRRGVPFAVEQLPKTAGTVSCVAVSPAGNRAVVTTNIGELMSYTIDGDDVTFQQISLASAITVAEWSPQGDRLALSIGVENLAILDGVTLEITKQWAAHRHNCGAIAWSADGRRLATTGRDTYVRLWDVDTERLVWEHIADNVDPSSVAFDSTGNHLVTGGFNRQAVIWDVASGEPVERLDGHRGPVRALAFSADGETLYTAGLDGQLFAWDWATRTVSRKFQ